MSVYIKDMDMPIDCLGCRIILCEKESYLKSGRPNDCPLTEVVHCKDCANFDYAFNYCDFLEAGVEGEDFFCAYGERKE